MSVANIKIVRKKINELKPARYNPRKDLKPEDKEYQMLKKSIEEFKYIEPILINHDGTIIAGHQRFKVLKDLGYKEIDCTSIRLNKTKEKILNIGMNKIGGAFDMPILKDLLIELDSGEYDIELTGFAIDELEALMTFEPEEILNEDKYTDKIDIPQYEFKGDNPELKELCKDEKTMELLKEIEKANITKDEKEFLKKASSRHLAFDYRKIAEYYAGATPDMQRLMEKSALIIIDTEDAIKNGYMNLNEELKEIMEQDNEG